MISSTTWVPRGFPSEFPEKYEMNDVEMERIEAMANLKLKDAQDELAETQKDDSDISEMKANINKSIASKLQSQDDIDDDLKEYDLEHYDDDETYEDSVANGLKVSMLPGLSSTGARYHEDENNADGDAYITLPTEREILEEKQELQVYPTDNMILSTRTEDDISFLDVYVYDDGAGAPDGAEEEDGDKFDPDVARGMTRDPSLYVHHDIMLPSFPLCVEWLSYKPFGPNDNSNVANFAAVGTLDPQIEIWNLDCVDKAFPDVILGEPEENSVAGLTKKKTKKNKKGSHVTTHHTDAVLSLSHNRSFRSVLASCSADCTVKLWDLNQAQCVRSMNKIHQGKQISSSQWSEENGSILLTGGYDGYVSLTDVRITEEKSMTKRFVVGSGNEEVETACWGPEKTVYAGTDQGNIYCLDIRAEKSLWTLHAHDSGISTLDRNRFVDGLLATGAMGDKNLKLWNVPTSTNSGNPSMILSRDFGVGNVLASSFAPDVEVAGFITIGGASGSLQIWDSLSNRTVRKSLGGQLKSLQDQARERAMELGRSSRISRKYRTEHEQIMVPDAGEDDDDERLEAAPETEQVEVDDEFV
ncbi:rRNA processing protein [Komagataella phaffii CBS 7435]|uniref:Uncharacterized protein n=2 Tax=Komagataella phaffii TaxID=460519 RepID=C4R6A1_KOMPG|nr:uncharacterized protein PAS_chr3_1247 [Komagataella phaffii GS115]AOA63447.1 GQ67_04155T0 [Komagataella phaffii]CAH2449074.1 rRNA processing protein [Komagataella phaffii CBS 7435]AOA69012.1 GQ68_04128T0 [Komagataella phaffii GS115]CAY71087.1 hypothetical protein PAS_chr3_1247 [Komagataella phaffii GS115]CCA39116.1 rRNA processing protein [Komagataella phaffii CBS 7435]